MDKQQSIKLVKDTFESSFEKGQFKKFVKNLLNQYEEAEISRVGNYIPDSFKNYVSKYERLGKYFDKEGNRIDILTVFLKRTTSIEHARSMQRNFIAGYLQGKYGTDADKDAALVAFVSPNSEDWRFSLVKLDVQLEATAKGGMKPVDILTPARRWSFLVGSQERSHTAQRQFVPIIEDDINNPSLSRLEEAFNIEKVTKEFFEEYRNLFIWTKIELDKVLKENSKVETDFEQKGIDTVNFAKKLLGQIIFLYYLQKKGWFGVPRDSLWGEGSRGFLRELFEKKHGGYDNFFNDILEPLFYEALRIDRSHDDHYYSRFNCKIPFLNGGLFDPMNNYDWVKADILLPNVLFSNNNKTKEDNGNGILDIFDRYNFTVKEDEPYEKEVAIDPELLGKAYEKFNAIRPDNYEEYLKALKSSKKGDETKFNKQYGVYYTPREIVHYMCQQSLINYLYSELNPESVDQNLGDDRLNIFGNVMKSGQVDIATKPQTSTEISKEDIAFLIQHGESLHEHEAMVNAKGKETGIYSYKLPKSVRKNSSIIDEKLATIKICDPTVGSGAFPVGMMSEIVKARQVLDTFTKTDKTIYDFKRECIENSLYGVDIDAGAVEIAKLRLWLSLVVDEEDPQNIKPLPNLDYKIVCGNSLIGFPENWGSSIEKEIESLIHQHFNETNPTKKDKLKKQIDDKIKSRYNISLQAFGYHISFDFRTVFSEVFQLNGGFDVVIANPPYVRQEEIKDFKPTLQKLFECYAGTADLFVYFFEKGIRLLRTNGIMVYISSNKYFRSGYGEKLRAYLGSKTSILQLIDFGDAPIFDAIAYPSILITQKKAPRSNQFYALSWQLNEPLSMFREKLETRAFVMPQSNLTPKGWHLENQTVLNLLDKLRCTGVPLKTLVEGKLYSGIKTGLNEAFVVDQDKYTRLVAEHPSSKKLLKPFLRGRDVKRWKIDYAKQYIIKIESSENQDHPWSSKSKDKAEIIFADLYPSIYKHLHSYRDALIKREDQGNYYWELRSCIYWSEFEKPKIVYPDIAKRSEFTFDTNGYYLGNTMYLIPTNNLWLISILNSRLIFWYYTKISSKIQSDFVRWIAQYVSQIPIVKPKNPYPLETLVERIIAEKHINPHADISRWEKEIDQLIYHHIFAQKQAVSIR